MKISYSFFHKNPDIYLGIDKMLLLEKLQAGFLGLRTLRDGTMRYSFLIEKSLIAVFLKMFMYKTNLKLLLPSDLISTIAKIRNEM